MEKAKLTKNLIYNFLPIITVITLILVWWILALIVNFEVAIPKPFNTFIEFLNCFISGDFYVALLFTILRAVICFLTSYVLGFTFAYISYKSKAFKRAFSPIISILSSLPTMSIILIILLWVSFDFAPILVGFLVVFPLSYSAVLTTLSGLDGKVYEMAKIYNIPKKTLFKKYTLKTTLESISLTAITNLSLSVKVVISAEVMAEATYGIGRLMRNAKVNLNAGKLFALSIVAIIISALLSLVFKALKNRFLRRKENGNP